MSVKCFIIFGPPGVGKGTQSALLSSRLGFCHISTGNILREEIKSGSTLGLQLKNILASGALVPDSITMSCLERYLNSKVDTSNILLDGIPRTEVQVDLLDELMNKLKIKLECVIAIEAPLEKLISRFDTRYTCSKCNQVQAVNAITDIKEIFCDGCKTEGSLFKREDDKKEVIENRMKIYSEQTRPILKQYLNRQLLIEVYGLDSVEMVYAGIVSKIVNCL